VYVTPGTVAALVSAVSVLPTTLMSCDVTWPLANTRSLTR
jgi:hypothetical protein